MAIPNPPSSLSANVVSNTQVDLSWTDNSSDETGFRIEESVNVPNAFVEVTTVLANVVTHSRVVDAGTRLYYRVRAYNGDGNSAYSNTVTVISTGWPQVVKDIGAQVYFDWDRDGSYTDETAYLISARGTHRIAPLGQSITATSGRVSECTVVLDNTSERFSSFNTGGALYSYIGSGKAYHVPVKIQISSVDAGSSASYQPVFTGVARIPSESTLSPTAPKTITFDCRGMEEVLLNRSARTTRSDFANYLDTGFTESQFMDEVIDDSGATITTVLDDGAFTIPWLWLDNESIVEELWKLAAACGGRFYGDAYGRLVYENATHWLKSPHTTSQQSYTRSSGFGTLELVWDETELAEEVSVTWTERELAESATIFDSENIIVPAGETITVWADYDSPLYAVDAITVTAGTAGGTNLASYIAVTPTYYAQAAKLSIANSGTIAANVRVKIEGYLMESIDSKTVTQESADSFWTSREGRSRRVSGNRYVQSSAQANMLKAFMADRQETPPLLAKMRNCPGNPLRVVGDRITITDTELDLSATAFFIVSVAWQYTAGAGYRQDIDAIRAADMFTYEGGAVSGGYFFLGTGNNTLGTGSSKPGKLFY
jgi:hypothetical protein